MSEFKEFFINKYCFENNVTPWQNNPVPYRQYTVCTTVDFSPGKTYRVVEIGALEKLKTENEKLRVNLNTCKKDYWFMTNLLERYSTNKDEAIKDCIERMKFRKGLFNILNKDELNKQESSSE